MRAALIFGFACAVHRTTGGAPRATPRAAARARISLVASSGLVLAPRREAGFDDLVVGSACVKRFLSDDGEQWMMWYSGRGKDFDKEVMQLTTGQIGLATSTNGIDWKREGAVFTENKDEWYYFDTAHVGIGDVQVMSSQAARTGGVSMYWCYYFGGDFSRTSEAVPKGTNMAIGLAMSSNGRNWGRVEGACSNGAILEASTDAQQGPDVAQQDSQFVGWPQVVMRKDEDYVLYYHTVCPTTGQFMVAAALGKDGVAFAKHGPVLRAGTPGSHDAKGASARHVLDNGMAAKPRYTMFYEAIDDAGTHSIALAQSDCGLKWSKVGDRPVFAPSTVEGAWDAGAVGRPNVVKMDGGRYRLYYYGQSGKGSSAEQERCGIGMAECDGKDLFVWERRSAAADPHA